MIRPESIGPLAHLMEGYEAETDLGPTWIRPLDTIIETAKLSEGEDCPKCGHRCKLFFGDPDGDYWCVCCQAVQEFGLKPEEEVAP